MSRLFRLSDHLQTVESTNEYLKPFIEDGIPRRVVARHQSRGKGRFGRSWYSPLDDGLYVSYLFFPDWEVEKSPFLTMISGLAVIQAVHSQSGTQGLEVGLKPPNDVLISGKKLAGILTELGSQEERILWSIVGIGVNLNQRHFPEDLVESATSLVLSGIGALSPLEFCDTLTTCFEKLYSRLEEGQWRQVKQEYRNRTLQEYLTDSP